MAFDYNAIYIVAEFDEQLKFSDWMHTSDMVLQGICPQTREEYPS